MNSQISAMNGFELAKDLRYCSTPAGETVPIILLASAEDTEKEDILEAAEELDIRVFFRSPLDEKELASFLSSLSQASE